jgi:hypothetical protein
MLYLLGGIIGTDVIIPVMIFAIPIIAIVGGITAGIIKQMSEAKLIENTQRERLAAIQRGVDPNQLPPLPVFGQSNPDMMAGFNPAAAQRHRAQGLLIGGIITLFGGIGLAAFLYFITGDYHGDGDAVWAVGILPMFIGVALLLSSWLVWPKGGSGSDRSV